MSLIDLQKLISQGESERLELKGGAVSPSTVAEIVCAFLNSSGGQLLIGVGEQGEIPGVKNAEALIRTIKTELSKRISPSAVWTIESIHVQEKNVVLVEVPEGKDKPYVSSGAIYLRRGERIVPANRDDITQLIAHRAESSQRWELQVAVGVERADLDDQLISETLRLSVESQRWRGNPNDTTEFLSSLGLIDYSSVTNAALLLYGRNPTKTLPQARARFLVLPAGKTGNRYSVDRLFEDCLLKMAKDIPETFATLLGGAASEFGRSWQRADRELYPISALREGVMNALVHRDYGMTGSVTLLVGPKALEISNPGSLPVELKPTDLKKNHPSLPRNPVVAHICFLHGLIEKVGRGTQRIVEDFKAAHLREPRWQSSASGTTLILPSPLATASGISTELNDRQQKILAALAQHQRLRPPQLARLVGELVTERTVRNDLQTLIDRGLVTRRGRGRSTSYVSSGGGSSE